MLKKSDHILWNFCIIICKIQDFGEKDPNLAQHPQKGDFWPFSWLFLIFYLKNQKNSLNMILFFHYEKNNKEKIFVPRDTLRVPGVPKKGP